MKKDQIIKIILLNVFILLLPLTIFAFDVNSLKKAAEQGNAQAQCDLGACYDTGVGVTQSYEEAVKWYRKAAEQGYARAQCYLGECYNNGEGVAQSYEEAVKWYRKAAEQGDARAQFDLGECYEAGEGVPKNYQEAVKWYRKAAEQGDADAQFNLGSCYENGKGILQNYEEAVKWYRKAAEQGYARAQNNLGWCYKNGEGVPQSYEEAVRWYRKSAEQGNAEAQNALGWYYGTGNGVKQSNEEAVRWYRKAAEQGYAKAQNNLGLCYENGEGVPQNYEEAVRWYRKAAEQGDCDGQFNLGFCYENGKGVPINFTEAVKWYGKAAEQGDAPAQSNLKKFQNLTLNQVKNQILTWEQYYNNNRKEFPKFKNEEEIRKTTQADVERWQEKGEFESTLDWKERVNDITRNEFICTAINTYVAQYNNDIAKLKSEQEKLYSDYEAYLNEVLNSFYDFKIQQSLKNFHTSDFELMPYDADHQTFLIHSSQYGDLLLPIPKKEAPSFKENWSVIKNSIDPEFVPNGEEVALSKLVFKNNGKEYIYDSHTQANYTTIDIEYNFPPIGIQDIDISNIGVDGISAIPADITSTLVGKTSSDVLTVQNAKVERVSVSASEKSDVDTSIPQTGTDNTTTTFAVIIANENYHSVSKVPYASKDGEVLGKYLINAVGLPREHVKIYKNASFGHMAAALKNIEDLSEAFGNDLNLIFYYAGHGMPNEKTKNPMLVPVDGDAAIPETCYELDRIISKLGGLNANSVVVMLDACFSGTERGDGMLMAARGIRIKSNQSTPTGNMVILTASQGDETAYPYETEQHGLFTYFLLKKLQENKGDVTLGELADYITEQVKRQSVVSNGKLQTPTVSVSPSFQNEWRNFKLK